MFAYLARGGLAAAYFAVSGIDPTLWLRTNAEGGILVGLVLIAVVAVARRRELAGLPRDPAMLLQSAYLALVAAALEEFIFRGAFLLPAAVTPLATALAIAGSSIAYATWRAVAVRARTPRAIASSIASSVVLAAVTALTGSLWPAFLAHAGFVLVRGRP
ncbi:MAG: hypothetical protein AUH85_05070 [Chloroflexi bacterium 13_1_40CM_4_68_4]|nr:MAG: hypothetical protein AUH85_05070 [Chloroflexi bacterium 13_1_40CM_4_68_4]